VSVFNIGNTDRDGRQKRIEHGGRYLRASRTGGVALRAQTKISRVNVTANTSHGVRISTRLAKNTQVGFQNGRFVLRGRYGSDAAKLNLSKSGATVSTKTPVGTLNWIKPKRSSFTMAGIQLRGEKAVILQAVYGIVALAIALVTFAFKAVIFLAVMLFKLAGFALKALGWLIGRLWGAAAAREHPRFEITEIAAEGVRRLADQDVDLRDEPARDLLAALSYVMVALGRGQTRFDPEAAGMENSDQAAAHALATDMRVASEQVAAWLPDSSAATWPRAVAGVAHALAAAYAGKVGEDVPGETLLALDDACLAGGPRTILQEEMIDTVAAAFRVDLVMAGETEGAAT